MVASGPLKETVVGPFDFWGWTFDWLVFMFDEKMPEEGTFAFTLSPPWPWRLPLALKLTLAFTWGRLTLAFKEGAWKLVLILGPDRLTFAFPWGNCPPIFELIWGPLIFACIWGG